MSNDNRKATDILLDIENRLGRIEAEIKLTNAGQALLLKRINESSAPMAVEVIPSKAIPIPVNTIKAETNFDGGIRRVGGSGSDADVSFRDYIAEKAAEKKAENPMMTPPKIKSIQQSSGKKIPVVQKVQDTNKKDVFMAEILITDNVGNMVLKTKTNALGKWQAQLSPGDYSIRLTKSDVSTGRKLELEEKIRVPESNTTVNLPMFIIER